eukprot:9974832-Ditylum_brightwellii.AAC.1
MVTHCASRLDNVRAGLYICIGGNAVYTTHLLPADKIPAQYIQSWLNMKNGKVGVWRECFTFHTNIANVGGSVKTVSNDFIIRTRQVRTPVKANLFADAPSITTFSGNRKQPEIYKNDDTTLLRPLKFQCTEEEKKTWSTLPESFVKLMQEMEESARLIVMHAIANESM